ncbi:MAG: hypothetical protein EBS98_02010 [Chitinophagia bacterium]|nr:hypothetical protein [Chitinophagia bacterium]
MNYTESFGEFASRVTPTDLALYAGVGLVVWVLFKEKLSPVQQFLGGLVEKLKGVVSSNKTPTAPVSSPKVPVLDKVDKEDIFFKLVVSWKQTRDLAVASNCTEAVKVADQMFPYLSPVVCGKDKV